MNQDYIIFLRMDGLNQREYDEMLSDLIISRNLSIADMNVVVL